MDQIERRGFFDGLPFRREIDSPTQFHVVAEGGETIHKWLKLKHLVAGEEALRIPIGNGENELKLGLMEIEDPVLTGVSTVVIYDQENLSYVIGGVMGISIDETVLPKNPMELISRGMDKERFGRFDTRRFRSSLQKAISGGSLQFTPDSKSKDIEIESRDVPGKKVSVFLKEHELFGFPEKIIVRFEGDMEEDGLEAFKQNYEVYARAFEAVVNGYYGMQRASSPDRTFVLTPPKNTDAIVDRAVKSIKNRKRMLASSGLVDGDEDLMEEVKTKIQLERRPTETFDLIGGNDKAKQELMSIVHALKDPEAYRKWGTSAPRGILLYGEPGTGKTVLAKALANKAEAGIYVVNTADVLHSLYGKTERLVQAIFDNARQNAPVVILFDELDALAGNRDHSTEVTSRIVSVLLTNLDGLEERNNGIVVVGTTNRLGAIDQALKRPGRFDLMIEVPMPESAQRADIFRIHQLRAQERAGRQIFDQNIDVADLADATQNFSGADIEEIIRRTGVKKVRQEEEGQNPGLITIEDLLDTIAMYENIRKAKRESIGFQPPTQ